MIRTTWVAVTYVIAVIAVAAGLRAKSLAIDAAALVLAYCVLLALAAYFDVRGEEDDE